MNQIFYMNPIIAKKELINIKEIVAGDKCYLKEIFHPDRDDVKINYSLAYAYVNPNGKTLSHFILQSENYYIISGKGIMHIDDESFEIESGSSYIVPPKSTQWIENVGNEKLEFLVIVEPAWQQEDEFVNEIED